MLRTASLMLAMCIGILSLRAQSVEQKLIAQEGLDSLEVSMLAALDTLAFRLDLSSATVDTTVVLSDTILYSVLMLGDASATGAEFYLITYDRVRDGPIQLVHVCGEPDIDQSLKHYSWTTHSIGHDKSIWAIEYKCRTRKDRYGELNLVEWQAIRRRIWDVLPNGQIQGGMWIEEKR